MDHLNIGDLAKEVLDAARQANISIATAESCTGGMVAAALTDIAGSSDVFERGYVTYSNAAKSELLGVPSSLVNAHGAVSEEVARAMADGALQNAPVQLAVAITGVAGPGGTANKPEGLVWFATAKAGEPTLSEVQHFGALGRSRVRQEATQTALSLLRARIR